MRIFEINNFLNAISSLLLESFKDDMYKAYPEEKNNMTFNDAIKFFNTHAEVKNGIKKMVEPGGNLAVQIKKRFKTGQEFIDVVFALIDKLNKSVEKGQSKNYAWKNEIGKEYNEIQREIKSGKTPNVSENDFWVIPCRTYEELHSVTQKYTGNLPVMSRDEIKKRYNIEVPEDAQHYDDEMTPEEFFEWAKNEDRFFMDPSWCIAKNESYFDGYHLSVYKEELPRCYVIISKLYPNLRFCIQMKGKPSFETYFIEGDDIKIKTVFRGPIAQEIRDPWQIGGIYDSYDFGLRVMELAFGKDEIKSLIHDIEKGREEIEDFCKVDELQNGSIQFSNNSDIKVINNNFTNLTDGSYMFNKCDSLKEFNGELPELKIGFCMFAETSIETFDVDLIQLKEGNNMFANCKKLKLFNSEIPNLKYGNSMFTDCGLLFFEKDMPELVKGVDMFCRNKNLKKFNSEMPKLEDGNFMFGDCVNLTSFESDLPSLGCGRYMFNNCNLKEFFSNTRKLIDGGGMFYGCKQLRKFKGDLSSLRYGQDMFEGCKLDTESVKNIAETISNTKDDYSRITIGVDEMDEEKEKYIKMIKEKGWKVEIR